MKRLSLILFVFSCVIALRAQLFMPSGVRFSTAPATKTFTAVSTNGLYEVTVEENGRGSSAYENHPQGTGLNQLFR